ncbi:MAG: hypothetical protein II388_12020 [Clostridia bacterium]|nr:hypothetical protein [Clostridia bacterium]
MNEREQLVNAINGCAGLLPQMEQLEDKIEITEAKIEKNRPRAGLLALAVIGVLLFFTGVSSSHDSDKILIPVGLFLVGLYVIALVYTKKKKQKLAAATEEYSKILSDSSLAWMPVDYRNSGCISKVAEYIRNNRADTLRECINLLEVEMHQNRMERTALVGALYAKEASEEARAANISASWRW